MQVYVHSHIPDLSLLRTVISWGSAHVGGLFNGACGTTTKARLPAPLALSVINGTVTAGGLDTAGGAYRRRWAAIGGSTIEIRVWAHRTRKHVLVADVTLVDGPGGAFVLTSLWDPLTQVRANGRMVLQIALEECVLRFTVQSTDVPGNGCAGSFSVDFDWFGPNGTSPEQWGGVTRLESDIGQRPNISVALDPLPSGGAISLSPSAPTMRFLAAVATSIDEEFPGGNGSAADVAALALDSYFAAAALVRKEGASALCGVSLLRSTSPV